VTGVLVLVVTLMVATLAGVLFRRRSGQHRVIASGDRIGPADIGAQLGERATLLQFSSAFCQPCRATRRVLGEVSQIVPGVRHVEVDAESHLDLVRRLDVRRTPTVLLLDADGVVSTRASGQPTRQQVIAALGTVIKGPIAGPIEGVPG
jgi:thiol-disulfide isomerase/thioredoxin